MELPLPPNFTSLREVGTLAEGNFVNVVGVIVDFQAPAPTRKTDWQCTMNLQDPSLLGSYNSGAGVKLKIFNPPHEMPQNVQIGDIALLRSVRTSDTTGNRCLLKNYGSELLFFAADSVPSPDFIAAHVSEDHRTIAHTTLQGKKTKPPGAKEQDYIIKLRQWALKHQGGLPQPDRSHANAHAYSSDPTARVQATPASGGRRELKLLEGVRANSYYDLVGEIRKLHDGRNAVEVYISDYTFNPLLFDYKETTEGDKPEGRDGDEYGYTSNKSKKPWPGPFGKMTVQITLWDPHGDYARNNLTEGDVVYVKNVLLRQKDGGCLQGSVHLDSKFPDEIKIRKLKDSDGHTEALVSRREQYWMSRENRGRKPLSRREKKKLRKNKNRGQIQEEQISKESIVDQDLSMDDGMFVPEERDTMNKQVACAHDDKPTIPLSKILETPYINYIARDGSEQTLPFVNMRCRTNVRVVDFFPSNMEDFAQCVDSQSYNDQSSQYDESSMDLDDASYRPRSRWEWAFYLLVEDARPTPGQDPVRMVLLVAGKDAEYLLKLDAVDLRHNLQVLHQVKRKLFQVWGDLAEKKESGEWSTDTKPSNRPFECCVLEYGAPEGSGWRRMHRITKTTIH